MDNKKAKAYIPEITEGISLCNELYSKYCQNEIKETDKHNIIVKICEIIGSTPDNFCKGEDIFNEIKYEVAKYVLHHEYCPETKNEVRPRFLLWLDSKAKPEVTKELSQFFDKYLK